MPKIQYPTAPTIFYLPVGGEQVKATMRGQQCDRLEAAIFVISTPFLNEDAWLARWHIPVAHQLHPYSRPFPSSVLVMRFRGSASEPETSELGINGAFTFLIMKSDGHLTAGIYMILKGSL